MKSDVNRYEYISYITNGEWHSNFLCKSYQCMNCTCSIDYDEMGNSKLLLVDYYIETSVNDPLNSIYVWNWHYDNKNPALC